MFSGVINRQYVKAYIDFPKPLIGVINGPAVGVSVTLLGLFDVVYATERVSRFLQLIHQGKSTVLSFMQIRIISQVHLVKLTCDDPFPKLNCISRICCYSYSCKWILNFAGNISYPL